MDSSQRSYLPADINAYDQGWATQFTHPELESGITQAFQAYQPFAPTTYGPHHFPDHNPGYMPHQGLASSVYEGLPDYQSPYQTGSPAINDAMSDHALPQTGKPRRKRNPPSSRKPLQTGKPRRKRNPPSSRKPPHAQSKVLMPRSARGSEMSKRRKLKEELGDSMGPDFKKLGEHRWENGVMLGLIDNEWKRVGFHEDYRKELILIDAQQPGAPIWRKETGTNYTSYSPIVSSWTEDPASILDSKGRQVCYMTKPADSRHNPKCEYLMYAGLILLDKNYHPVKDYPGAPLTLDIACPVYVVEGLKRVFGMTYNDIRARMILAKMRAKGPKDLSYPAFSERTRLWRDSFNKAAKAIVMPPWLARKSQESNQNTIDIGTNQQAEEHNKADFAPALAPAPFMDMGGAEESNQYSALDYPRANLPAQMRNNVAADNINTTVFPHSFGFFPQNIYHFGEYNQEYPNFIPPQGFLSTQFSDTNGNLTNQISQFPFF